MKLWVKQGLIWGLSMFLIMDIILPLAEGDFSILDIIIGIPLWTIGGLIFGYAVFGWNRQQNTDKHEKMG